MKALRIALCLVLLSFSIAAEKSFDQIISLAGTWEGTEMTFLLKTAGGPDDPVVEVSGSKQWGYMEHAVFTTINASRHIGDWIFLAPGNHPPRVHFDLHRVR